MGDGNLCRTRTERRMPCRRSRSPHVAFRSPAAAAAESVQNGPMPLNFRLKRRWENLSAPDGGTTDDCVWNRTWCGWDPNLSSEDVFEQNRGVWNLGDAASQEHIATMSFDGAIQIVAEISRIENVAMKAGGYKQAVVGRVLGPGDPAYRRYFLMDFTAPGRNPVSYH